MTPQQKIKHMVLALDAAWGKRELPEITSENIDELYKKLVDEGAHWDALNEIRVGDEETNLPCPLVRHYESKSVAAKAPDGSWVGWTYWYGGGKHSNPEEIDWIDDAYDLDCEESERLVVTREFTRKEAA